MTLSLVHLDVLVAPEPDKISRKKCTPTVALLPPLPILENCTGTVGKVGIAGMTSKTSDRAGMVRYSNLKIPGYRWCRGSDI